MADLQDYTTEERGFPDAVKEWIDNRVHGGLRKIGRGIMQVAISGFGKGLLATTAIFTVAFVAASIIAPGALLGTAFTEASSAQALAEALPRAINVLAGSMEGLLMLGAGGTFGSMAEAHRENARLNATQAKHQAEHYAMMRGISQQESIAPVIEPEHEKAECRGGHCAKLLHERQQGHEGLSL